MAGGALREIPQRVFDNFSQAAVVFLCTGILLLGILVRESIHQGVLALIVVFALGGIIVAGLVKHIKHFRAGRDGFEYTSHGPVTRSASLDLVQGKPVAGLGIDVNEEGPLEPSGSDPAIHGVEDAAAARTILASLLAERPEGPLAHARFHLYMPDAERDGMLMPAFDLDSQASTGWKPGNGATGRAFITGRYVLVQGSAVADGTFGLSEAQQDRYRDLKAVAAMPLFDLAGRVFAVLTVTSADPENLLDSDEAFLELTSVAVALTQVFIDILGWFAGGD